MIINELLKIWYTVVLTFLAVVVCAGVTELLKFNIMWIVVLGIAGFLYVIVWKSILKRLK